MSKEKIIIIKKYANRRLYNTEISNYVTLEDLFEMVKKGINFIVKDAKTEKDITRNVLTQIILEQESKGYNMLPVSFLRQVISFYGDKVATILPQYLEYSMNAFYNNRENMENISKESKDYNPMKVFGETIQQNISLFEETMNIFYGNKMNKEKKD